MTDSWQYGPADTEPRHFPWPPAEGGDGFGAFGQTWKAATFEPTRFFGRLPRDGGTGAALLYYLIVGILTAGASLFWDTFLPTLGLADDPLPDIGVQPVIAFLLSPVILLLGIALAAGFTHLVLLVVGGARHGFQTSLRTFAYAYSPMIFGIVPVIGTFVGVIWMLGLAIIGLREAHETVTWKPALAVLFPFFLFLAAFLLAVMALIATAAELLA
jgi:hypothetical protein